jgi:uncharacterized membrane protein
MRDGVLLVGLIIFLGVHVLPLLFVAWAMVAFWLHRWLIGVDPLAGMHGARVP